MARPIIDISREEGLDWAGGGYVHRIHAPAPNELAADETVLTVRFARSLDAAKRGDFTQMMPLFDVMESAIGTDQRLAYFSTLLLGDAGTPECYDYMIRHIQSNPIDYERTLDFCNALSMRGRLADIPVMLGAYRRLINIDDADIIPTWMSDVLDPEPGDITEGTNREDFDEYADLVLSRQKAICDQFGTDQVLILKGSAFTVRTLARLIRDRIGDPDFDVDLRRRIEATSGLDFALASKDGRLQPLKMMAMIEEFLEQAEDQIDLDANTRYFFRHPLPR